MNSFNNNTSQQSNDLLYIDDVEITINDGLWRLDYVIHDGTDKNPIFFEVQLPSSLKASKLTAPIPTGEVALLSTIMPAMKSGKSIENVPYIADDTFQDNIAKAQRILIDWFSYSFVAITHDKNNKIKPQLLKKNGLHAMFFSSGVDSWHTLIEMKADINALIAVNGFDVPLSSPEAWELVSDKLSQAARKLDLPLITVKTNLRDFSDKYVCWDHYHGSALGAVAAVLSPIISTVYISSSFTFEKLYPYGSHPKLDVLWSATGRRLIHYGCHANRIEKTKILVNNKIAREYLRVCWRAPEKYNCSNCQKCTITMLGIELHGQLKNTPSFMDSDLVELTKKYANFNDSAPAIYFNELINSFRKQDPKSKILAELLMAKKKQRIERFLNRIHLGLGLKKLFKRTLFLK